MEWILFFSFSSLPFFLFSSFDIYVYDLGSSDDSNKQVYVLRCTSFHVRDKNEDIIEENVSKFKMYLFNV
jgi:hypothetical protein